MTPAQWRQIEHFNPGEKWGDPEKMDPELIFRLDRLRKYINRPIRIHCGFEHRETGGFHPLGLAVDCHAEGLQVLEFYIAASRFRFGGIGVYTWWNHPGLHLDNRPVGTVGRRALWGSPAPKLYVEFDADFIRRAMDTETNV